MWSFVIALLVAGIAYYAMSRDKAAMKESPATSFAVRLIAAIVVFAFVGLAINVIQWVVPG